MLPQFRWMMLSACASLVILVAARADDETPKAAAADNQPAAESTADDVAELIKQLDDNRFSQRQAASRKLFAAGKSAIPALAEAAAGNSREVTTRAIDVLKSHLQNGDEASIAAAKEALDKIAQSDNPTAARAAEEALRPKEEPNAQVPGFPGGGIQIQGGQIQIQVQAIAGGNGKRTSIKIINGVKEIDAQDNDRKVKIIDDPNNGIKIEVTEKNKEGKEETKKYEAKNADELKKNHPDAHKIYEEYSKQQGIQIRGIQFQGGVLPAVPQPVPIQPNQIIPGPNVPRALNRIESRAQVAERLAVVEKQLDELAVRLKELSKDSNQADQFGKSLQQLEEAKKQLQEAKAKLEPTGLRAFED
jgi:hypothetical protein